VAWPRAGPVGHLHTTPDLGRATAGGSDLARRSGPDHVAAGPVPRPAMTPVSAAGELLRAALICLPLKGVEVALGHGRLLGAEGAVPEAGNPLP
jgi:hypothetical protein